MEYSSLKKLTRPGRLLKNAFSKLVSGPLKYKNRGGYRAADYWRDRLGKHGPSFTGVGDEGLDEKDNKTMYVRAGGILKGVIKDAGLKLGQCRILDIGCGNGFYAGLLAEASVRHYTGLDITDALFPVLRQKYPGYRFIQADITAKPELGRYDLVVMIDVIEHIVSRNKLESAMATIRACLAPGGLAIISPISPRAGKRLFHLRFWTLDDIAARFPADFKKRLYDFRGQKLLVLSR